MDLALQQSPEFERGLLACGQAPWRGAAGLMLRRRLPLAGWQGVLSRSDVTCPAALRAARRGGLRIVNAECAAPGILRAAGFRQILTPAHIAELPLRGDLRAAMHLKWRNRLRRAEAAGLTLWNGAWSGAPHWLIEAEARQRHQRRYAGLPAPLVAAIARETPGCARIIEAWEGATPIAAMLFLRHGARATYQAGWTSDRGRALNAHCLTLFVAALWMADHGHRLLDLGPVETDRQPGLARFKLGSGARARAMGGTWLALPGR
ncbi:MAG: GNAT family N-acetyltransferase [Alphaproteobacteria bacterium]|jgi:hypothetical protein|nr:GNAT family N-acetyltransferase [Alphaproteobacteria bacterium]